MKVSIITVCFNSEKTIEDTLKSVTSQTYPDIEYIVVDGLSKDGTNEIVQRYSDIVSVHVSEKDNGLYDAMNKGIQLATGDVIGILNSDDIFFNEIIIQEVVDNIQNIETLFV
jgi:glycosyltransferase involved in cell wall biosynthesis